MKCIAGVKVNSNVYYKEWLDTIAEKHYLIHHFIFISFYVKMYVCFLCHCLYRCAFLQNSAFILEFILKTVLDWICYSFNVISAAALNSLAQLI